MIHNLPKSVLEEADIFINYEAYIKNLKHQVEEFRKMESKKLPEDIVYADIKGIRIEARQKLDKIRPENIGQASRISGVSPADIAALMIYLEK